MILNRSRRFPLETVLLASLAFLVSACGSDEEDGSTATERPPMPVLMPASAATKQVLALTAGYQSWSKFPENQSLKPSPTHKNMQVISYYNDAVGGSMTSGSLPLPDGALIVKENWAKADDPGPMALTIMHKQGGDWYWCQVTPDGQVFVEDGNALEGKNVAMCTNCHKSAANDAVLTHTF